MIIFWMKIPNRKRLNLNYWIRMSFIFLLKLEQNIESIKNECEVKIIKGNQRNEVRKMNFSLRKKGKLILFNAIYFLLAFL